MDWLIAVQRWLYGGTAESMRSAEDLTGMPALIALAFLLGIFMPRHGKTVLVSYHLGRVADGRHDAECGTAERGVDLRDLS